MSTFVSQREPFRLHADHGQNASIGPIAAAIAALSHLEKDAVVLQEIIRRQVWL